MTTTVRRSRNDITERLRNSLGADGTRLLVLAGVFVLLAIFFQFQSDGTFLSSRNLTLLLRQGSIIAILATGVTMLIVRSEIDLSIGSAVFLAGTVAAMMQSDHGQPTWVAVVAALAAGMAMGATQGLIVVKTAIPSFIVTLAGLLAFRGLGLLWTDARTVRADNSSFIFLSEGFISANFLLLGYLLLASWLVTRLLRGGRRGAQLAYVKEDPGRDRTQVEVLTLDASVAPRRTNIIAITAIGLAALGLLTWISYGYAGLSVSIIWVLLIGGGATFLMTKTPFGRNAYLIGSNREAALYAGVNVGRNVVLGFIVMGLFYGIGGVLLTARLGAATPGAGEFYELDAIAAAVIGGAALRGGRGTVTGAIAGAVLLTTINNGMSILNISSFLQLVVKAVVLILALALNSAAYRRRGV